MHKLLPFLLLLLPLSSLSQDFETSVHSEAAALVECSLGKGECNSLLDIPWDQPAFQFWLSYYRSGLNRAKLLAQLESFRIFYPKVKEIFRKYGIPEDLALLAIVESKGDPSAVSRAGAAGLWQLMPSTARRLGLKVNWLIDERFNPIKSTEAAAKYLKELHSYFHRWDLAIAAYNAGPGTILNRLKRLGEAQFWDLTKLPNETLNYVPKFYAVLSLAKESSILEKPTSEKLLTIKVSSRTTLRRIARVLRAPYSVVRRFNREFKRGIVPRGYYIYLPSRAVGNTYVLKYAKSKRVFIYVPKRRETLISVARKFGVSPNLLKELNRIRHNTLIKGRPIIIVKINEKERDGKG